MLEVQGLSKSFGRIQAVKNLNFKLDKGTVLGFLGPNGAGKTTTMRMLSGYLEPSAGSAIIMGHDICKDSLSARKCIGYLPEGAPLYAELSVRQFLVFIARVREVPKHSINSSVAEIMERLYLTEVAEQSIETLSKGFRRRVGLAQALIHDPAVLLLDEPTDGLDPNQKREVRRLIQAMSSEKLIIISTHILEEVSALCNRAMIIANGQLLADDTPLGLLHQSRYHQAVTLRVDDPQAIASALSNLPQAARVELRHQELTVFPIDGAQLLPEVSKLAEQEGWQVHSIRQEEGRLDDVFRKITTEVQA